MSYRAWITCDEPGCNAAISAQGESKEIAQTEVQALAVLKRWFVARDRLFVNRDKCPQHSPEKELP